MRPLPSSPQLIPTTAVIMLFDSPFIVQNLNTRLSLPGASPKNAAHIERYKVLLILFFQEKNYTFVVA
jgi:hypothetical protein